MNGNEVQRWADGSNGDKLEENGFAPLIDMDDIGLYTDEFFITSKEYIENNKGSLSAFLKASAEVETWVEENKEEAAKIAASKIGMTQDQFLSDLAAKNFGIEIPDEALEHLSEIKNWAVSEGRFEDFSIEDFVDASALK